MLNAFFVCKTTDQRTHHHTDVSEARDREKPEAIPTSHRISPASLVAEATALRAIPRSKHGLDLV
jgi:hypothetical protein